MAYSWTVKIRCCFMDTAALKFRCCRITFHPLAPHGWSVVESTWWRISVAAVSLAELALRCEEAMSTTRVRRLYRGGRGSDRLQGDITRASWYSGWLERWVADGGHAHATSRSFQSCGLPDAAP